MDDFQFCDAAVLGGGVSYEPKLRLQFRLQGLLDPHHGLHELGRVPHRHAGHVAVPVHQVIVDVPSHQPQHVADVGFVGFNDCGRDVTHPQRQGIHLCTREDRRVGEDTVNVVLLVTVLCHTHQVRHQPM